MNPDTPTAPKYTTQSFSQALRTKFPTGIAADGVPYAKMTDQELTKRMVAKYPVYKSQIHDPNLGELDSEQVKQGAQHATEAIQRGAGKFQADMANPQDTSLGTEFKRTGDLLETGLGAAAGGAQAVFAPFTAVIQKALSHSGGLPAITDTTAPTPLAPIEAKVHEWAQAHPDAARNFMDALTVGGTAVGDIGGEINPLNANIKEGVGVGKGAIQDATSDIKNTLSDTRKAILPSADEKAARSLSQTIDAVNPDLSGKKLTSAYKGTVTGKQNVTPASLFKEQGLTPDERTINLGTRLHDLGLTKDHVKNLDILGKAMTDTENKISEALRGDSEIKYNADKPNLVGKLEELKSKIPGEFSAIKDSKTLFNHVVNFAKDVVGKTEDSIEGIRNARTKFDSQAKSEYPSAFKEGTIDTATPAGRAIKAARDIMNSHLYETAPNGSEIQRLIGREADIFKAAENIAPKAAKGHKLNLPEGFSKRHPLLTKYIKYGIIGGTGGLVGHTI